MTHRTAVPPHAVPSHLDALRALDTCTVSNAIERLDARLRNEGFISGAVRCRFPHLPPIAGYAATARVRTTSPPMARRCYYDRPDWWNYVATLPEPRILILQDIDHRPGVGALLGEIHTTIAQALKCVGCVTNGAVRDLGAIEPLGFQLFSGDVSVSHSYAHIVEFGEPVEIGSLRIASGDLLHGDRHGVLSIPPSVAAAIPAEAARLLEEERELIQFCRSPEFDLRELEGRIQRMCAICDLPWPRP